MFGAIVVFLTLGFPDGAGRVLRSADVIALRTTVPRLRIRLVHYAVDVLQICCCSD